MDGAMPKTVLIILAAVVALIVIVVLTGMRYLRADDEDDFDDDVPAEHGRSRSHGGHPAADEARPRQRHLDDRADDRHRERVGASRGARPVQGREERGAGRRGPDQRGTDQRGPGRRGDDRSWREEARQAAGQDDPRSAAGQEPAGRSAPAAGDQRPARGGRRDRDISEPMAAVARSSRSLPARGASRGGDDYDSQPGRRVPDYDRDPRDSRNSRDRRDSQAFRERPAGVDDDYAARRDSREPGRDRPDRGEGRVSRDRSDVRDKPAVSPRDSVPGSRDDSDRDDRDRRSATRPNARPDARKNGSAPDDDLLPAVKPRQGRGKRDDEGDWPSNEWDELSDVDFWAELASDKPFPSQETAEPARAELARTELPRTELAKTENARAERRGQRADRDVRPDRDAKPERSARPDRDTRRDRDARQDAAAGLGPSGRAAGLLPDSVTKQFSRQGRELDSGLLPAARHRDLPADRSSAPLAADPLPAIADDDPLTSPSFPRVAADDSRSYRRTRPEAGEPRHGGAGSRMPADPPSYPGMPRVEPVRGIDGASTTRRHSLPAARAAELTDGYRTPAAGYPAHDLAPAGDPYGSLPPSSSAPAAYQTPAASYETSSRPAGLAADGPTASYSVPAHSGGYHVPSEVPYGGSGGYQAAPSYPAESLAGGYQNGSGGNLPSAGNGNGFAAETSTGSYQSLPPAAEPYRPDLGPGSYQGTSSYSRPAGYGSGAGDLAADYPANGYLPSEYQGYGGAASASGSHQRPEPGYLNGSYSGGAEHAPPSSLPAAQPDLGYPVYPAPVPTGQNGYSAAAPQPPGYDTPAYPGGFDPAGYQLPAREPDGYAGADPYAVDPYGQYGYGSSGY
jgi:hypothetical protein